MFQKGSRPWFEIGFLTLLRWLDKRGICRLHDKFYGSCNREDQGSEGIR